MVKTQTRRILIRADTVKQAKRFAGSHRKLLSNEFLPERIVSVKLNKSQGLAGGVKGFSVVLSRKKDTRERLKDGRLASRFRGKKPRL